MVVGNGQYGSGELTEFTGIATLGEVPWDPAAARVASGESAASRRLGHSLLWDGSGRLARALYVRLNVDPSDVSRPPGSVTRSAWSVLSDAPHPEPAVDSGRADGAQAGAIARAGAPRTGSLRGAGRTDAHPSHDDRSEPEPLDPFRRTVSRVGRMTAALATAIRQRVAEDLAGGEASSLTGDDRKEFARQQVFRHLDAFASDDGGSSAAGLSHRDEQDLARSVLDALFGLGRLQALGRRSRHREHRRQRV